MTTAVFPGGVRRERATIIVVLLAASAAAWLLVAWLSMQMDGDDEAMLTMGLSAPLFIATWSLMMAAMMLPAASPMVDAFIRIQTGRKDTGTAAVPVSIFLAGYLLVGALAGVVAFAAARVLETQAMDHAWLMDNGARLGGALIIAAGAYQLSPLKRMCLGRCRTPMSFIVESWRDGRAGALRMGIQHGAFCFGCCWLLFAILFPLGLMNVAIMATVAAFVFVEKVLPHTLITSRVAAIVLIAYGALVLVLMPDALPTMM